MLQAKLAMVHVSTAHTLPWLPLVRLQAGSFGNFSTADLASLADLEGPAPSLGALYGQSASWGGSLQERQRSQSSRGDPEPAGAADADGLPGPWQRLAGLGATPQSRPAAPGVSPLLFLSPSVAAVDQSDVFKSANLPLWASAAGAGNEQAAGVNSIDQPSTAGVSSSHSSWRNDRSSVSRPSSRPQSAGSLRQQQQGGGSGPAGSYAAAWRRQASAARPAAAAAPPASIAASSLKAPSQQAQRSMQHAASGSELAAVPSSSTAGSLLQPLEAGQSELAPAELSSAEAAGLLEELQREQRISSALLQQLHEVQRQLEEAAVMAAAAAATQQPPVPGVQDPADFDGLLSGEAQDGGV